MAGGFTTDRDASWENWELLLRVMFCGFKLDVVSRPSFWYRKQGDGFGRITRLCCNQRRVLNALLDGTPKELQPIMRIMAMTSPRASN